MNDYKRLRRPGIRKRFELYKDFIKTPESVWVNEEENWKQSKINELLGGRNNRSLEEPRGGEHRDEAASEGQCEHPFGKATKASIMKIEKKCLRQ